MSSVTTLTYNQLVQLLANIAGAHQQLKSFGSGFLFEVDGTPKNTGVYPELWMQPITAVINENTVDHTVRLIVFDLVAKDNSNFNEVMSDSVQILGDIIKVLRYESETYQLIGNPTLEPFRDRFADEVSGWGCEVTIQVLFPNGQALCDLPMTSFGNPEIVIGGFTIPQGTSGYSGFSGINGSNGISGYSGFSGGTGTNGSSGISGFSGTNGSNGSNGASGFSGYSGYSGDNAPGFWELFSEVSYPNGLQPTSGLDVLPNTDCSYDLGHDNKRFKDLYLCGGIVLPSPNGATWYIEIDNTGTLTSTMLTPPESIPLSGLKVWLDANDTNTIFANDNGTGAVANGGTVGMWADISGNSNNVTQATSGKKPTWNTNQVNSLPSIRFDGVDDFLRSATFTLARPETIYIVVNRLNTNTGTFVDGFLGNTGRIFSGGGTTVRIYAGDFGASGTVNSSQYTIIAATIQSSGSTMTIDGGSPNSNATPLSQDMNGIILGIFGDTGSNPANIDIAEVIVYNRILSGAEDGIVVSYLQTKYGL